ncbi:MAG: hypothetical protein L3J82_04545 [Planctomycetes bacterium]|nr:hypothetical protein [Planctomycetota bacterium]
MPDLKGYQSQFGEKGLHIFSFEQRVASKHKKGTRDDAISTATSKELPYPASFGGASKYQGDSYHPWSYGWLIGIEGKVIWAGNPGRDGFNSGLDDILNKEMAKIKYPGLGKHDIDSALDEAAKAFCSGKLGRARELAKAESKNKSAKKDAKYIAARIDEVAKLYEDRAKQMVKEKRYLKAKRTYEKIVNMFEGQDEAKDAEKALAKFKKNKKVQKELAADIAWEELQPSINKQGANKTKLTEDFIKEHKGTNAAKEAQSTLK